MAKFLTLVALIIALPPRISTCFATAPHLQADSAEQLLVSDVPQIVINELMVDPTPVVGLPPFEWIELHNPGNAPVNLNGWKITVGNIERRLPQAFLAGGAYIILCSLAGSESLSEYGKTMVIQLPALRNSGNLVLLSDSEGNVADKVDYSDSWYDNNTQRNGGYTLERIDPLRSCDERNNWGASKDAAGGTPGQQNSIFAFNPDTTPPVIEQIRTVSTNSVILYFSESIEPLLLKAPGNYTLGTLGHPVTLEEHSPNGILLRWAKTMETNRIYRLEIDQLTDLCGNQMTDIEIEVIWNQLRQGDIIINEVLFNPLAGGADYVELYNPTNTPVDLHRLVLAGRDNQLKLRQFVSLGYTNKLLRPRQYLAFTTDPETVATHYPYGCRSCLIKLPAMPAYNNDRGWVVLLTDDHEPMDEFAYTEKMHHPLLHNVKGVSLERVSPMAATQDPGNWQSAAADAGFGTPGTENSQKGELPGKVTLTATPRAISPNDDGFNDSMEIFYTVAGPGWMANAWIFDLHGKPLVQLLKNQLIGTEGSFKWEGREADGKRVAIGPYLLMVELYDLYGKIHRFREAVYITDSGR